MVLYLESKLMSPQPQSQLNAITTAPSAPQQQSTSFSLRKRMSDMQKQYTYIPYIYALICNFTLVFMQMNMKYVSLYTTTFHALAMRGFFLFTINSIVVYRTGDNKDFALSLKRSIIASVAVVLFLGSLKHVPTGTVNALFNTGPILVCFVEAFYYNKPLHRVHFILSVICFSGILLILRPEFIFGSLGAEITSTQKFFMTLVLLAALCQSFSNIFIHQLKGKVSSTVSLHYFYLGNVFIHSLGMNFQKDTFAEAEWDFKFYAAMTGLVVFAFITQNFMTRAVMLKKPSYIMPFGYLSIIFSVILDEMIFGTQIGGLMWIGMSLTSVGLLAKLLIPEEDKKKQTKI